MISQEQQEQEQEQQEQQSHSYDRHVPRGQKLQSTGYFLNYEFQLKVKKDL